MSCDKLATLNYTRHFLLISGLSTWDLIGYYNLHVQKDNGLFNRHVINSFL